MAGLIPQDFNLTHQISLDAQTQRVVLIASALVGAGAILAFIAKVIPK